MDTCPTPTIVHSYTIINGYRESDFLLWDRHKIQEYRIIQQSEWYHTKQENIWRPATKQADKLCGIFWPEHFRFDVMPLWILVKYSIFWLQALRQLAHQAIYREENGRHHTTSHNGEDDHEHRLNSSGDVADLFV